MRIFYHEFRSLAFATLLYSRRESNSHCRIESPVSEPLEDRSIVLSKLDLNPHKILQRDLSYPLDDSTICSSVRGRTENLSIKSGKLYHWATKENLGSHRYHFPWWVKFRILFWLVLKVSNILVISDLVICTTHLTLNAIGIKVVFNVRWTRLELATARSQTENSTNWTTTLCIRLSEPSHLIIFTLLKY